MRGRDAQCADHASAISAAFGLLEEHHLALPTAVGHRVVHGGPAHDTPEIVDAALLDALRRVVRFAPLHLPAELSGIEAVAARFPHLPQVVCFDTGFHRGLPEVARRFPLPSEVRGPRASPLRIPRPLLRVSRRDARRGPARTRRPRPSRQRRQYGRRQERRATRHDDGAHADRRLHDGHAHRRSRSRPLDSPARRGTRRKLARAPRESRGRAARRVRLHQRYEGAARAASRPHGCRPRRRDVLLPRAQVDRRARRRARRARFARVHGWHRRARRGRPWADLRRSRAPRDPHRPGPKCRGRARDQRRWQPLHRSRAGHGRRAHDCAP